MQYTGKVIAKWKFRGKRYEAKIYEDGFGYIVDVTLPNHFIVGHAGYDYFLGHNWKERARILKVYGG